MISAPVSTVMNYTRNLTSSGILCKHMNDEGYYGDEQLRITGNESGSVEITGDGITISNGVIKSMNYKKTRELEAL